MFAFFPMPTRKMLVEDFTSPELWVIAIVGVLFALAFKCGLQDNRIAELERRATPRPPSLTTQPLKWYWIAAVVLTAIVIALTIAGVW